VVKKIESSVACPGLFYPITTGDGYLWRVRTVGGMVNSSQLLALAEFCRNFGKGGECQITNRGNLQIRSQVDRLPQAVLAKLQDLGLAARLPELDRLRNVAISPTAGIDATAIFDPRNLSREVDRYLSTELKLTGLSAKFSIGIDGGERVSICSRSNEIWAIAKLVNSRVRLAIGCGLSDGKIAMTGIEVLPDSFIETISTIADIYLEFAPSFESHDLSSRRKSSQPRFRELIERFGMDWLVGELLNRLPDSVDFTFREKIDNFEGNLIADRTIYESILGIHLQDNIVKDLFSPAECDDSLKLPLATDLKPILIESTEQLYYLGIDVPLGILKAAQLEILARTIDDSAGGEMRLTPWRSILIPHIPRENLAKISPWQRCANVETLPEEGSIQHDRSTNQITASAIVACVGSSGCSEGFTRTQEHARLLAKAIATSSIELPVTSIHLTSCPKACAHPYPSDITLLGTKIDRGGKCVEAYEIYVREGDLAALPQVYPERSRGANHPFGRSLGMTIVAEDIPLSVIELIHPQPPSPKEII
jgi:ferredoxin-nitrite reductase